MEKILKIGVIGAGGRTGTMFARELKKIGKVFGIAKEREVDLGQRGKIFVKNERGKEKLEIEWIKDREFPKEFEFDFLFLTVPNPVKNVVKFYFQKIKEKNLKITILFLSQNGIEAAEDAILALEEIFGKKEISIFRISLFNPVDKKVEDEKIVIEYSLPIRMGLAKVSGREDEEKIEKILRKAGFEIYLVSQKERKNMEYSKLFLNLIGIASATHGFSIFEGFSKKEIFKEEILALREYIKVVKKKGGKFLNFPHYPVKTFSLLFYLPFFLLVPFRKKLAQIIEKGRKGKPKDLREIEYYNGAVVKLGKEVNIKVEINAKILKRAKLCLSKE